MKDISSSNTDNSNSHQNSQPRENDAFNITLVVLQKLEQRLERIEHHLYLDDDDEIPDKLFGGTN